MVSVDVYPTNNNVDQIVAHSYEHLTRKCLYRSVRARQLIVYSDKVNKISILSPLSSRWPLDNHLIAFRDRIRIRQLLRSMNLLDAEASMVLSIGVIYYGTMTCTIPLSASAVRILSLIGLPTEFDCYPASED